MFRNAASFIAAVLMMLSLGSGTVAGGGCEARAGSGEATGESVSIRDCAFGPAILRAPLGATVTWTNDDYLPHAVNGPGWNASTPFTPSPPGGKVSYTFTSPGIYPYMCYLHPGMAGIVVVGDAAIGGAGRSAPGAGLPAANEAVASTAGIGRVPAVELPVAALLIIGSALCGYALARWPLGSRPAHAAVGASDGPA